MKKENFLNAIKSLRKNSKKRKFDQTLDLVVNLKEVDKKNTFDAYVTLPHSSGRSAKICAIVDSEYEKSADALTDKVINKEMLMKLQAKDVSKLAKEYDIFIAQASLMGQIASALGKILGPLGKMPNPKSGGVLMPGADIKLTVDKFRKNMRVRNRNESIIKSSIGKESFNDEALAENADAVYEGIVHVLPNGEGNVKDVLVKFTMSKPVIVGKGGGGDAGKK
ncbi:hypothetical protein HYV89_00510 [Candidatus Woesearchaeota archaeon]|nr:hypothetical protein [Candidatus Woesearchaeota archaeon]